MEMRVTFEDCPYRLGETINIVVELIPKGDAEVRKGWVDLVCDQRYTEVYMKTVPATHRLAGGGSSGGAIRVPGYTKQVTEKRRANFIHSTATFMEDTRLQSGTPTQITVKLEIKSDPPPHATKGTVKWELLTSVDVANARDVSQKHALKIELT